jgi:hypothetical protein
VRAKVRRLPFWARYVDGSWVLGRERWEVRGETRCGFSARLRWGEAVVYLLRLATSRMRIELFNFETLTCIRRYMRQ